MIAGKPFFKWGHRRELNQPRIGNRVSAEYGIAESQLGKGNGRVKIALDNIIRHSGFAGNDRSLIFMAAPDCGKIRFIQDHDIRAQVFQDPANPFYAFPFFFMGSFEIPGPEFSAPAWAIL